MKDYSRNYNEARKFIKSYKIENGEIIIQYASGETKTVQFKLHFFLLINHSISYRKP